MPVPQDATQATANLKGRTTERLFFQPSASIYAYSNRLTWAYTEVLLNSCRTRVSSYHSYFYFPPFNLNRHEGQNVDLNRGQLS